MKLADISLVNGDTCEVQCDQKSVMYPSLLFVRIITDLTWDN